MDRALEQGYGFTEPVQHPTAFWTFPGMLCFRDGRLVHDAPGKLVL
jgi:hypothetical protein